MFRPVIVLLRRLIRFLKSLLETDPIYRLR